MSRREVEARFQRRQGMSAEQQRYVEQETAELEWYTYVDGKQVRGTLAELVRLNEAKRNDDAR